MRIIDTKTELVRLADELGVRFDWHKPDEQGVIARVEGTSFNNTGMWPTAAYGEGPGLEIHVVLSVVDDSGHDDECEDDPSECGHRVVTDVAAVNLATLFSWATRNPLDR